MADVGAVPAAMFEQVPRLAASAQDWQVPVHALAQHTPCAQNPELHSVLAAQLFPSGFFVQSMLMQKYEVAQSVSAPQVALQILFGVSHWYSLQDELAAAPQVPVPLQVRGEV
jgi:hypothetical protein